MEHSANCAGEPNVPSSSSPPSPSSVDDEPISVTPRNTVPPSLPPTAPTAHPASDCTDSTDDHDNDDGKQRNFVRNLSDKNFRGASNVVRRPAVGLNTNSRSEQRDEIKVGSVDRLCKCVCHFVPSLLLSDTFPFTNVLHACRLISL